MQPIIEIQNVEKKYPFGKLKIHALKGISLSIYEGDFLALRGKSGSGKSSLLRILGCLDRPTSGQVFCYGESVAKLSHSKIAEIRNQKIGFVFQNFHLIPFLNGLENIELPYVMGPHGTSLHKARERSLEIAEMLGISHCAQRRPNEMSGGEQQRVAIGRALMNAPRVLVLDEPTANLDSKTGEALIQLLIELNQQQKVTLIFGTHDDKIIQEAPRQIEITDGVISHEKREPFLHSA